MQISSQEFSRVAFQTIGVHSDSAAFPQGCLSVINGLAGKQFLLRFQDGEKIAFAHLEGASLGKSLTIFNSYRDEKAKEVSCEELAKIHIQVGKVKNILVSKVDFSNEYEAFVDIMVDKSKLIIQCLIPKVSPSFSLNSRKVIMLMNLKPECISDYYKVHILCGENQNGDWIPFSLTDDSIAAGTRARF